MRTTLIAREFKKVGKLGYPISSIHLDAPIVQIGYRSTSSINQLKSWAAETKPTSAEDYINKFKELLREEHNTSYSDYQSIAYLGLYKCKSMDDINAFMKQVQDFTPAENSKSLCVVADISQLMNEETRDRLLKNYVQPFHDEGYAVEIQVAHHHESFDPTKYDVVVNATEVYTENYYTFNDIYIDSTNAISHRCYSSGTQYIHIGSLMAQLESKSLLSDKIYRSQDIAVAGNPNATVLRPGFTEESHLFQYPVLPRSSVRVSFTPQNFLLEAIKTCINNREKVSGEIIDLGVKEFASFSEFAKSQNASGLRIPTLAYEAYATLIEWVTLESNLNRDVVLALKGENKQVQNDGYGTIFKSYGHFVNNPANLTHKDIGLELTEQL